MYTVVHSIFMLCLHPSWGDILFSSCLPITKVVSPPTFQMKISFNFSCLLIAIWRFTYYYGSLIRPFFKELLLLLTCWKKCFVCATHQTSTFWMRFNTLHSCLLPYRESHVGTANDPTISMELLPFLTKKYFIKKLVHAAPPTFQMEIPQSVTYLIIWKYVRYNIFWWFD